MKMFWGVLLFFLGAMNPVFAQADDGTYTHVQLVSEQNAVFSGKTFWVGIDFILDDGWHMYWQNPGDSGLAPKIKWQLPSGIKAGNIRWPYPQRMDVGPLTTFGYEHELLLLVPVRVDQSFQDAVNVSLRARVDWLACREECVPGRAQLNLTLPVVTNSSGITFNNYKISFDQTRQRWPKDISSITSRVWLDGNQWHMDIKTPLERGTNVVFFPLRNDVIEHAAPQKIQTVTDGYQLTLVKSHIYPGSLTSLEGVAVNPAGWDEQGRIKAIVIQAPVESVFPRVSFLVACFLAFMGGLILNLMPCVLPVLSIKVLHLIARHPDKKIARRHALTYMLGVLVSVWVLALLLFILKSAGQFAGWGFQFQSPVFVLIVAVILFILALNLFGVFEISIPMVSGLSTSQGGYQSSFFSGVLTSVVASSCTAPFMGTALTVAIGQPGIVGLGIFTFLGIGLAFPFVLLSVFPALLSFVPKPGAWMIFLKRILGGILLGCVIWLLWVWAVQTRLLKPSVELDWQKYSSSAVAQARQAGHGVFIDFTAGWCINCQVNDRLVLQNPEVIKAFKDEGISAFKADWTRYDPDITRALSSLGRDSVPVYVYYPPGADTPIILPQIITPKMVLERVRRAQ